MCVIYVYIYIYIYVCVCIYIYIYMHTCCFISLFSHSMIWPGGDETSHEPDRLHSGVCEINTDLDGAGIFNVPTLHPDFKVGGKMPHGSKQTTVFISQAGCTHLAHVRKH